MVTHELWRARAGGTWAVELTEGVVSGVYGPLDASEIDPRFLDSFEYSGDEAARMEAHRDEYELFVPEHPYAV